MSSSRGAATPNISPARAKQPATHSSLAHHVTNRVSLQQSSSPKTSRHSKWRLDGPQLSQANNLTGEQPQKNDTLTKTKKRVPWHLQYVHRQGLGNRCNQPLWLKHKLVNAGRLAGRQAGCGFCLLHTQDATVLLACPLPTHNRGG